MMDEPLQKPYTCSDYRGEMILLALKRRLETEPLDDREKAALREEIRQLRAAMGMA
ncbi:MAG: hypothetical protein JRI97_00715 [Deltaproteobacteria bacterium]|nr:hypothetical protein [Deltaproteobacteria bacterium]